jgi:succinyl-CoA synthetase beta subunit
MKIHEYQAKELLGKFGIAVPLGIVAATNHDAVNAAKRIFEDTGICSFAVKAQVHSGGRGKAGGIKIAGSINEVKKYADQILGMRLITEQTGREGKIVNKVLVEQDLYYGGNKSAEEFYLSILTDRNKGCNLFMYSTEGGTDIEEIASTSPELIHYEEIDPVKRLQASQTDTIAFNMGLTGRAYKEMISFLNSLYSAYIKSDALLIEINPLIKTPGNILYAADAKINLDDNALFRHPEYLEMKDPAEEVVAEAEASEYNLSYIKLDGNIGCMVNGAGLAMATMDLIKLSGANPANFLDVGGSASPRSVECGFRIILRDKDVKLVMVNIFGGIVRCDRIAHGITRAYKSMPDTDIPVIVRLQGTNASEGKEILDASGINILIVSTLQEASEIISSSF